MTKVSLLLAATLLGSLPAVSEAAIIDDTAGFYAGGAFGNTNTRVTIDSESDDFDKFGFKVIGGYRFNPYFAIEGSYFRPSDIKDAQDGLRVQVSADFWQAALVGSLPFGTSPFSGFARLGVDRWDSKLTGCDGPFCGTENSHGTDVHWGAPTDRAIVRVEIEQTEIDEPIGDVSTNWRVSFLSVGMTYRF
jgi:OOP family OmpA-OmpF porin